MSCYGLDLKCLQRFTCWSLGLQGKVVTGSGAFKKWCLEGGRLVTSSVTCSAAMGWISLFFHGLLGHYSLQASRPNGYGLSPLKPWAKIKVSCFIQGSTIAMQCWVTTLPCKNLQINIFKYFWLIILNKLGAENCSSLKCLTIQTLHFKNTLFLIMCMHVVCVSMCRYANVSASSRGSQRHWILWTWSYRQLGATWYVHWWLK